MGNLKLGKMTMRSLFGKPETTRYPFEKKTPPDDLRGHINMDATSCILCGICERCCPSNAIVVNRENRTWSIDRFACVLCGYCTNMCPKGCLSFGTEYPGIATIKQATVVDVPRDVNA